MQLRDFQHELFDGNRQVLLLWIGAEMNDHSLLVKLLKNNVTSSLKVLVEQCEADGFHRCYTFNKDNQYYTVYGVFLNDKYYISMNCFASKL